MACKRTQHLIARYNSHIQWNAELCEWDSSCLVSDYTLWANIKKFYVSESESSAWICTRGGRRICGLLRGLTGKRRPSAVKWLRPTSRESVGRWFEPLVPGMVDANMPTNTDGFVSTKGIARFGVTVGRWFKDNKSKDHQGHLRLQEKKGTTMTATVMVLNYQLDTENSRATVSRHTSAMRLEITTPNLKGWGSQLLWSSWQTRCWSRFNQTVTSAKT